MIFLISFYYKLSLAKLFLVAVRGPWTSFRAIAVEKAVNDVLHDKLRSHYKWYDTSKQTQVVHEQKVLAFRVTSYHDWRVRA